MPPQDFLPFDCLEEPFSTLNISEQASSKILPFNLFQTESCANYIFSSLVWALGVILSTSSTHLLGVTFDKLAHVRWLGYKNWPGFFVCVHIAVSSRDPLLLNC